MATQKTRIQLDLDPDEAAALDAVRDRCRLRSRSDAVRTALAVIAWIDEERSQGRRVVAIGEEGISRLVVPGLTTGADDREERA